MFVVKDSVQIQAPIERVFLLSTSVDVVKLTLKMRPVGGSRMKGLIVAGDTVEWRGWKFGLPQRHTSIISGYQAPFFFQDTQLTGRFATFQHDHRFEESKDGVLARDEVRFSLPLGWAGKMVGRHVMLPEVTGLVKRRFALLKHLAEGDGWREWIHTVASAPRTAP